MTPDQLISTMHRQRSDQAAMRLALSDLAECLSPEVRAAWLKALQTRMATTQAAAKTATDPDQRNGLQALTTSLTFLHKSLAELGQKSQTGGG